MRGPLTQEAPGSEAVEPSPDGDEENPVITEVIEEIDDEEDDGDDEERPDQKDVVPGSDAAADDDALGVGKEDEPDTGPT